MTQEERPDILTIATELCNDGSMIINLKQRNYLWRLHDYVEKVEGLRKELDKDGEMPNCRAWALSKLKHTLDGES